MKVGRTAQMPSMVPMPAPGSPDDYARNTVKRLQDEVRRTETLCAALSDWLVGDARDQIAQFEQMLANPRPDSVRVGPYYMPATTERLLELTKRCNDLQELIETSDAQIERAEEHIDDNPGAGIMVAAVKLQMSGFRDQLESLEKEISYVQSELEKDSTSAADSRAAQPEETA